MIEAAESLVERVDDKAHRALTRARPDRGRRAEEAPLALEEVELLVAHLVPVVVAADGEVDAVVEDVGLLAEAADLSGVLDDPVRDHVLHTRLRRPKRVAVHLGDPRRLAGDVAAGGNVARDRAVDRPVALGLGRTRPRYLSHSGAIRFRSSSGRCRQPTGLARGTASLGRTGRHAVVGTDHVGTRSTRRPSWRRGRLVDRTRQ